MQERLTTKPTANINGSLIKELEGIGYGGFLTKDIRECLGRMSLNESQSHLERSHLADILGMIGVVDDIKNNSEDITEPDFLLTQEQWDILKIGFIFQDIGKGYYQESAYLYALDKLNPTISIGEAIKKAEEKFGEWNEGMLTNIRNYVLFAKAAGEIFKLRGKVILDEGKISNTQQDIYERWKRDTENLDKVPIRYFWDAHIFYSLKILERNKDKVREAIRGETKFEDLKRIVGAHHFVEGNYFIPVGEISPLTIIGELIDKIYASFTRREFSNDEGMRSSAKDFLNERINDYLGDIEIAEKYKNLARQLLKPKVFPKASAIREKVANFLADKTQAA